MILILFISKRAIQRMSTFNEKYKNRRSKLKTLLCVGLDPHPDYIPKSYLVSQKNKQEPLGLKDMECYKNFLQDLVNFTLPYTIAYKLNLAFYEVMGPDCAWRLLSEILSYIKSKDPGVLVIADAKRGDIAYTSESYARAFFESMLFDAITVSPYLGLETLEPFYSYKEKGVIVLCATSNEGASQFQAHGSPPLYLKVAQECEVINQKTKNLWLVLGGTKDPEIFQNIKKHAPTLPLLIPGVGMQGASIKRIAKLSGENVLINIGRSLVQENLALRTIEDSKKTKYLEGVEEKCKDIKKEINLYYKL